MAKQQKTETVAKAASGNGWSFMHPTSHEWTGEYKTRIEAREARARVTREPRAAEVAHDAPEKTVDNAPALPVDSSSTQSAAATTASPVTESGDVAQTKKDPMTVTFTLSTKSRKSTSVVYNPTNGLRGSLRCAKTFFVNGTAPTSLSIDSDAFATPKAKLTKEERKAQRANAPKLTAAQRLAKLQERAEKLQKKVAAEAAAAQKATEQPAQPTA